MSKKQLKATKVKSSEIKTDVNFNANSIEYKAKEKPKFSKKRIVLLIIFSILSILIIFLTFRFILNIDWHSLFASISYGFARKMGYLWFTLLLGYFVFTIFKNFVSVWLRLKSLGYKIPAYQYWLLGLGTSFLGAVTPPLMGDAFSLIWMKTNGVPTYRVSSILFSNTLFWQVIQIVVTLPSFFLVMAHAPDLFVNPEGITVFSLLIAGLVIDIISACFVFLLCWSKKIHYFLSRIFNGIKKKLHMKYHTKEETAKKYQENAVIKQDFIAYMKDWKTTAWIIGLMVVGELVTYLSFDVALYFVQNTHFENKVYFVGFDFAWAFNCTNVTFTANRLNFLVPGGEGSLEFILLTFIKDLSSWNVKPTAPTGKEADLVKSFISNGIAIWRLFGSIIPACAGLFGLIGWVVHEGIRVKKGNKFIAEEK